MVLAKLSNGVELDYRDSGKPEVIGVDGGYETLLCVHGVMFNQGKKLASHTVIDNSLR